jgi:hypothetical protein
MRQPERGQDVFKALGSSDSFGTTRGVAVFHTCCGQIDLGADWIERAIGEPLRLSPRWPKLAALMNLPASAGTRAP